MLLLLMMAQLPLQMMPVTNAKIANATIDLAAKVTGVLPIANGGTGAQSADAARTSLGIISGTLGN